MSSLLFVANEYESAGESTKWKFLTYFLERSNVKAFSEQGVWRVWDLFFSIDIYNFYVK